MDTNLLLILLIVAVAGLGGIVLFRSRPSTPEAAPNETESRLLLEVATLRGVVESMQSQSDAHRTAIVTSVQEGSNANQTLLSTLGEKVAALDAAQANINALQTTVNDLVNTFSNNMRKGKFGERVLEDILRDALVPGSYKFQVKLSTGVIADCLVALNEDGGAVAIDSKFPLTDYTRWLETPEGEARKAAAKKVESAVKARIDEVAKYLIPGETREVAFMFVPAESIFSDLNMYFHDVVLHSYKKHVYLASPNTLHAYLVSMRLQQVNATLLEQWATVRAMIEGREGILENIRRLDERVGKLSAHFEKAQEDIGEIKESSRKVAKKGQMIRDAQLESVALTSEISDGEASEVFELPAYESSDES